MGIEDNILNNPAFYLTSIVKFVKHSVFIKIIWVFAIWKKNVLNELLFSVL